MRKILSFAFLLSIISSPAFCQGSSAEQALLGFLSSATTGNAGCISRGLGKPPCWLPYDNLNPLPISTTGGGSSITWPTSGDVVISNSTNSPAGLAPVNGEYLVGAGGVWTVGAGGSSIGLANTTSNLTYYLGFTTTTSGSTGTIYGTAADLFFNPSTGVLNSLALTTSTLTVNAASALNGTTTISSAQILGGNGVFSTLSSTTITGTNASLSGTTTLNSAQILAGNALLTTVTATNGEFTNAFATTITGTTGTFPTLNFTNALGTTITATNIEGVGNATLAGTTTVSNLSITGTCTGCPSTTAAGSQYNLQYNNGSNAFAAASALNVSATTGGLTFLAGVTTSNLLSLGDKGADVTSYALGESALLAQSTTNLNNTAIGGFALAAVTTGSNNTALGWDAGQSLTTDGYNTAVGSRALLTQAAAATTSALGNVGAGYDALTALTTGLGNTAIGTQAGVKVTVGSKNTIIGDLVATTTLTTGSNNILIGEGTGIDTLLATTTGFLNIGNTIFATGVNGGTLAAPSGAVGINTTAPNGVLDVHGGRIYGGSNEGSYADYIDLSAASFAPDITFSLSNGASSSLISQSIFGTNDAIFQFFGATGAGYGVFEAYNSAGAIISTGGAAKPILFDINRVEKGRFDASGDLDLGQTTSSNSSLLTVNGSITVGTALYFATTTATAPTNGIYLSSVNTLEFTTSGSQSGLINSTGNNSTSFGYKALTAVTTGIDNTALGYQAGALITTGTGNTLLGYNTGSTVLTIGSNNILIGNSLAASTSSTSNTINIGGIYTVTGTGTASSAANVINGTMQMPNLTTAAGAETDYVCLDGSGNFYADSAACISSSKRWKNNINPLTGGLAEVLKMQPVTFYFNKDHAKMKGHETKQTGFIAEDMDKVDPTLTVYDLTGKPRGVHYELVSAVNTEAIQEMQAEIKQLEAQIVALGGKPIVIPQAAPAPTMMDTIKHAIGVQ